MPLYTEFAILTPAYDCEYLSRFMAQTLIDGMFWVNLYGAVHPLFEMHYMWSRNSHHMLLN